MMEKICNKCKYCEEFNDKLVCTFEVYNNGCPEELPEKLSTCKDFELKQKING